MRVGDVVMILRDDVPGASRFHRLTNKGYLGMLGIVSFISGDPHSPNALFEVYSGKPDWLGDRWFWLADELELLEAL